MLGQSNSVESSICTEAVAAAPLRVTKRPSGGETVILTPATVAFTVARQFPAMIQFREFFRMVNSVVIDGLRELGVTENWVQRVSLTSPSATARYWVHR